MKINQAKKELKAIVSKDHLPVYLHSSPGLGKSAICKQIAEELDWKFIDIRLTMLQPSDLLGIPYPNKEHTKANWLRPSIFPDPDSKGNYLILLDELSNAPITIQQAAYRLVLDRSLGDHYTLPEGARIIAAGNKITDQSGVQRLSKALANRFIHFDIEPDLDAWKDWAFKNKMNEKVVAFLNFKTDLLAPDTKKLNIEENAYPTPRSWSYVSKLMDYDLDSEDAVAGSVGKGAAAEFFTYIKIFGKLPNVTDILKGKWKNPPKEPDVLYALCSSLVLRANKKNIKHIFEYTDKMSAEFHFLTIRDIARRDIDILDSYKGFSKWLNKNSKYFSTE